MAAGIEACGDTPIAADARQAPPPCDVVVFYGLEMRLPRTFREQVAIGRAVYVDLGYWGRREGGRWTGYHKVVVNARHPTAYFRSPQHDHSRIEHFKYGRLSEGASGSSGRGAILLAGMGDKGAHFEGYKPEQWERWAIAELRQYTDREIIYRPKPSWKTAKPLPFTTYSPGSVPLEKELAQSAAVVTHHSNVAVEAIELSIPTWCWAGVARERSMQDLSLIESYDPYLRQPDPARVADWMADIAWCQWSVEEMRRGTCWAHLKAEGLI